MAMKLSFRYSYLVINLLLVPQAGIEPTTRGFSALCSTYWATGAYLRCRVQDLHLNDDSDRLRQGFILTTCNGATGWIRTNDSSGMNGVLYQLSYNGMFIFCWFFCLHFWLQVMCFTVLCDIGSWVRCMTRFVFDSCALINGTRPALWLCQGSNLGQRALEAQYLYPLEHRAILLCNAGAGLEPAPS